ncbi:MAG: PIG-L deacetylase family protein [Candidatus Eisenbacteria bacterium]
MREGCDILGVFAHPDDESYGPGGALARYALEGAAVDLLVFTCGEAGSIGVSKELPRDELCRRRRGELGEACEALGVRDYRIVGLPDGSVGDTTDEEGARIVLGEIEGRRPRIVMTFHRDGVSGHPDHRAVTRFAREAFRRAGGGGPRKLYEWALPESKVSLYKKERRIFAAPEGEITTTIRVPGEAMDRKLEAIARHRTQIEFYHELVRIFGDYREATAREFFVLRESRIGFDHLPEEDLFEGMGPEGTGTPRWGRGKELD